MVYSTLRLLALIIFRILFRFRVVGSEHIPEKGGFILAGNHVSYLDPIALGIASFRRLYFMARHDLFKNKLFAWLLYKVGAFPLKRGFADLSAFRKAMQIVQDGHGLVLFPEGGRQIDGVSRAPEAGIGLLATKLSAPVIPALVSGTQKALPRGAKFIRAADVSVHFGKKISIERRMSHQEIAQLIMEDIRHL